MNIGPVYVTDILVLGTFFIVGIKLIIHRKNVLDNFRTIGISALPMIFFLIWIIYKSLTSEISFVHLRDLAPYAYIAIGLISISTFGLTSAEGQRLTFRIIFAGLTLHSFLVFLSSFWPTIPKSLPLIDQSKQLYMLSLRPDIDISLVGVLAAYLLSNFLSKVRNRWILALPFFLLILLISSSDSRAGFISALVSISFVLALHFPNLKNSNLRFMLKNFFTGFALVFTCFGLAAFQSDIPARIQGLFGAIESNYNTQTNFDTKVLIDLQKENVSSTNLAPPNSQSYSEATANARIRSWQQLLSWQYSSPSITWSGVGFGRNFMIESGAGAALLGDENPLLKEVRSPHNYLLGTQARLGIPGIILFGLVFFQTISTLLITRAEITQRKMLMISSLLFFSLIVPALFGVILEAPFGAIPFWWGIGIILANKSLPQASNVQATGLYKKD